MRLLCLTVLALIISPAAYAQDDGLYDPVAPEGSAFVRFIHADNALTAQDLDVKINGKSYGKQHYKNMSDYYVRKNGEAKFTIGNKEASQTLGADKYYSVLNTANGLVVVEDEALENTTKALLTLYNLTDEESISLKTTDKQISIIKDIAPNTNGAREINAMELGLTVESSSGKKMDLDPITLDRKNAYAILTLSDEDNEFYSVVRTAKTDTTK